MLSSDGHPLLQPIPGDNPAGDAAYFSMTLAPELRELRRQESADEFDDSTRPQVLKRADWTEVQRLCEEALREHSKDLRTACHLCEAWTRQQGLAGLAQGFELLVGLVRDSWDRLAPPLGDDPAESRGTPLNNLLNDPDRGVCFPNLLRTLPLLGEADNALSYTDLTKLRAAETDDDAQRLEEARAALLTETLARQHADASLALEHLDTLRDGLEARLGDDAPGLLNLRQALADLTGLLVDELDRRGAPAETGTDRFARKEELPTGPATPSGPREEIYASLEGAAERLRAMEPHSPIPYMIKRAVRLGRLPFPRLMEQVIREPSALTELNRELGIAEPAATDAIA